MNFEKQKHELVEFWRRNRFVKDEKVLNAFLEVPREDFVLDLFKKESYKDKPLYIGDGQTISQPTTVVKMLDALELENKEGFKVLEVGAGSGYNAALIGTVCERGKVYSIERKPRLVKLAKKNIEKIGLKNVEVVEGDGSLGYINEAPYDRIIVTAACPYLSKVLVEQLKENGVIVLPIGNLSCQSMYKYVKKKGKFEEEYLGEFVFVPLRGKEGFEG